MALLSSGRAGTSCHAPLSALSSSFIVLVQGESHGLPQSFGAVEFRPILAQRRSNLAFGAVQGPLNHQVVGIRFGQKRLVGLLLLLLYIT